MSVNLKHPRLASFDDDAYVSADWVYKPCDDLMARIVNLKVFFKFTRYIIYGSFVSFNHSFNLIREMVNFKFSNGGRKCIRQILQTYQSGFGTIKFFLQNLTL